MYHAAQGDQHVRQRLHALALLRQHDGSAEKAAGRQGQTEHRTRVDDGCSAALHQATGRAPVHVRAEQRCGVLQVSRAALLSVTGEQSSVVECYR